MDLDSNVMVNIDLCADNDITASLIPCLVHCILGGFACVDVLNLMLSRFLDNLSPR